MSTHTPGPWITSNLAGGHQKAVAQESTGRDIALVYEPDNGDAELIAKAPIAPKLAEALRVLTEHAQETYPHFESERGQRDIAAALAALAEWDNAK